MVVDMATAMEVDAAPVADEAWLIWRARRCLKSDPAACKVWLITAKTLFPGNFNIQVRVSVRYARTSQSFRCVCADDEVGLNSAVPDLSMIPSVSMVRVSNVRMKPPWHLSALSGASHGYRRDALCISSELGIRYCESFGLQIVYRISW